jgi:hypothetical protein
MAAKMGSTGAELASGMAFGAAAAATRLPTLTILAPAAMVIKRRRVGSAGSADAFVGGVLCTLSPWVIWIPVLRGSG